MCVCVCVLLHLFGQKWFRVSLKTSFVSRLLASLIPLITAQLRLADRGTITDYYNLFFFALYMVLYLYRNSDSWEVK